jgi:hypothetical protein
VLRDLRARNVFPDMGVDWGTYPINVGHERSPAAFAATTARHASADGKTISQDCETCHATLAMEEASPEILSQLGVE